MINNQSHYYSAKIMIGLNRESVKCKHSRRLLLQQNTTMGAP